MSDFSKAATRENLDYDVTATKQQLIIDVT